MTSKVGILYYYEKEKEEMNSPYMGRFQITQAFTSEHDGLDLVGLDSKQIHSTVNGTETVLRRQTQADRRVPGRQGGYEKADRRV